MKILIVEDYKPIREAVARGLKEAGFSVDATGDGEEGLWYAQSAEYDVLILDLMLPGMDGLALLKALRKSGANTSVLILTAKDTVADRVRGLELGADDYLVKPFAFEELLARVRALVRRTLERRSPQLTIDDLEVDVVGRKVKRSGRAVVLSAREYAILEYLALRAGQVVSRSEIQDRVYDFAEDRNSNVVDVYIGYLRRKLESKGGCRLIHTRRGMGYVLAKPGDA